MKKLFTKEKVKLLSLLAIVASSAVLLSSSHREAPMIANDPLADNTDLYAFRSPENPEKVIVIANFIPAQIPWAGPNYYHFGEDVRYEIHIDNNINTQGDDVIYRFTFQKVNEDPTTFFTIRLGKENQKTTYKLEKSQDQGKTWRTILDAGAYVPPPNIGPRSISSPVGLNAPDYNTLMKKGVVRAYTNERVFAGFVDDPFFVDLGGIFDLGDAPRTDGTRPQDGLRYMNVSTLALEIDIPAIQKNGRFASQANGILDSDYIVGIWASASRRKIRVLNGDGTQSQDGEWVQVSRLGMPLTNEAVIPIGFKDMWNSMTPYQDLSKLSTFGNFFYNPELALYMDDAKFGAAVPAFQKLRIQKNSLGMFGFGNDQNGLFPLKGTAAVKGTALDDALFGNLLLPGPGKPRSVDLWPIFHTGVPKLQPYQLATGKNGNPLAMGKPFINNFLPNGGDMLRLNMAVPATPRDSKDFSPLGLVQAAVLGLTDSRFNTNRNLQFIPNMDGFPNGRRLEDDVTRIELQAVSGIVLAAIGLWYDDFMPNSNQSPVTPRLLNVLTYRTGVDRNDTTFQTTFPFEQTPWSGKINTYCDFNQAVGQGGVPRPIYSTSEMGVAAPEVFATSVPNPATNANSIRYRLESSAKVQITVYDATGKAVRVLANKTQDAGTYNLDWNTAELSKGVYMIGIAKDGVTKQTIRLVKN